MSVIGLLGVCFVVMKILGLIDWSWWLVTAPFWGGFVFVACTCAKNAQVVDKWLLQKMQQPREVDNEID